MFRGIFIRLAAVAGFVLAAAFPHPAGAADSQKIKASVETAALTTGDAGAAEALPEILSGADAERYRAIFRLQEKGHWHAADDFIAKLDDRVLMGHVLAQRYLHPTKYRSRYKELKAWMAEYADLHYARQIYKLALRRKPKNWRAPRAPVATPPPAAARTAAPRPKGKRLSRQQRREVGAIKRKIRGLLRQGWTLAAKKLLRTDKVKRLFSTAEMDAARARLGAGYFAAGRDEWALQWAGDAALRSGLTDGHWTAGLAAWRLGRQGTAAGHFGAIVEARQASPWMISAAAFWAARAHLVDRQPAKVTPLLGVAAAYPHTFYGLLARRVLGLPISFEWSTPALEEGALLSLSAAPAGRRSLALIQVGEVSRAERELRLFAARADRDTARGILALAARANLPALSVRLNERLFADGGGYDGAAYPIPTWAPKEGYRIDRALIYALIRQESAFNPRAKSRAGARGLMQLMPRTASFVARDRRYRHGAKRRSLFEPEVNLTLGQKYIEILLEDEKIGGDLSLFAAAWNGGPGNLNKWRRQTDNLGDALFFMESIPSRETRNFVERVFTNLWIYRSRLGQPMPSLDAIASGEWPAYTALDGKTLKVATNAEK
ncbi:MAG: lytic transglycosylase domain-containing protein [Proteobacteria bacterium]|nr:lytic transglycosylase domain-containing protein [Pseudomonadota bacterium]